MTFKLPPSSSSATTVPWSDINLVVVTDVHSFLAGHNHHDPTSADYGDVLSFFERLQETNPERDLFFVMDGDFMDGTGLSTIPPNHLLPLLKQMPFSAATMGNHELYHDETVKYLVQAGIGTNEFWNGNYLTSNTILKSNKEPIGKKYTYLHAPNSQARVLTFGFLYNFTENCPETVVLPVQQVVKEAWFINVLQRRDYDAILVLAHMDYRDPLVDVIRKAIRGVAGPQMPIQFINGHSHLRGFAAVDETSTAFEAGHFLDTVGFASFPIESTVQRYLAEQWNQSSTLNSSDPAATDLFHHKFIDASTTDLQAVLGVEKLATPAGESLSKSIQETRHALGLTTEIGCIPQTFHLETSPQAPDSLWGLYMNAVVPDQLTNNDPTHSSVYFQSSGSLRYDLYGGRAELDDVIVVSPFNDTVLRLETELSGTQLFYVLKSLIPAMPSDTPPFPALFTSIGADKIVLNNTYKLLTTEYELGDVCQLVEKSGGGGGNCTFTTLNGTTTISSWVGYVRNNWPCHFKKSSNEVHYTTVKEVTVILAIVAMVLVVIRASQRLRRIAARGSTAQDDQEETVPLKTSTIKLLSYGSDDG